MVDIIQHAATVYFSLYNAGSMWVNRVQMLEYAAYRAIARSSH